MNCARARRLLPSFVGEDLTRGGATAVRAHLADCHACARRFASFREAREALRANADAPAPPPDLWARVEGALLEEVRAPRTLARRAWMPRVAAAVLVVAGVGAGLLGTWGKSAGAGRRALPGQRTDPVAAIPVAGELEGSAGYLHRADFLPTEFLTLPLAGDFRDVPAEAFDAWRGGPASFPFRVLPAGQPAGPRDF